MPDFTWNDGEGGSVFFDEQPNGSYYLYDGGEGGQFFGVYTPDPGVTAEDIQANGLGWAIGHGTLDIGGISNEDDPTGEGGLVLGAGEGESPTGSDGTGATGGTGEPGTGPGTGPGGTGGGATGGASGGASPTGAGEADSGRGSYEDALERYLEAVEEYESALEEYESALAEAEATGHEIEGLVEEAEGLGDDLEDLQGEIADLGNALAGGAQSANELGETIEDLADLREGLGSDPFPSLIPTFPALAVEDPLRFPLRDGEPVGLFSGAYRTRVTDFAAAGIGLPLRITRVYSNQCFHRGSFGAKWDVWFDANVREMSSGAVYVWSGDASGGFFLPDGAGAYTAPRGVYERLERSAGGFTLTDASGGVRTFDAAGRLAAIADRFGNQIVVERAPGGTPSAIVDTLGRRLVLSVDAERRVTAIADWTGRTWRYGYDAQGDLVSVLAPATPELPNGRRLEYEYGPAGPDARLEHNLVSTFLPDGRTILVNEYGSSANDFNRVVQQFFDGDRFQFAYEYPAPETPPDAANRGVVSHRTRVVDPRGIRTEVDFNVWGGALAERVGSNSLVPGSPAEWATTHAYDELGNHAETRYPGGLVASFAHDTGNADPLARGNLVELRVRSSDGASNQVVSITYGPFNQVASITAPGGATLRYDLDARGLVSRVRYPAVTLADGTPQQAELTAAYDGRGRLTSFTGPEGNVVSFTFSGASIATRAIDGVTQETWGYDTLERPTSFADAAGTAFAIEWDALDQLRAERAPAALGYARRYDYDTNGYLVARRERRIDADGNVESPEWLTETIEVDARGRPVAHARPLEAGVSATTRLAWDVDGNLLQVTHPDGLIERFEYDERGLLVAATFAAETAREGRETHGYDVDGNRIRFTDALGNTHTFAYDGFGRIAAHVDPNGEVDGFAWDADNRLVGRTRRDAAGTLRADRRFLHDALGRLHTVEERVIDPDGADLGAVAERLLHDRLGRPIGFIDRLGNRYAMTFDRFSRLIGASDPLGNETRLTRDARGSVTRMLRRLVDGTGGPARFLVVDFGYDVLGRLTSMTDGLGNQRSWARDSRGLARRETREDGVVETIAWDLGGRPRSRSFPRIDGAGNVVGALTETFAWNAVDRPTMITNARGLPFRFTYDDGGAIESMVLPDGTTRYTNTYDAAGNVIRTTDARGVTASFRYDALHRPIRADFAPAPGVAGNAFEELGYDANGYLASARNDAHAVAFATDSIGRRWSETLDGRTTRRTYAGALPEDLVYPSGLTVRQAWDVAQRLSSLAITSTGAGFPGGASPGTLCQLGYLGDGLVGTRGLGNGVSARYAYDGAGRPLSVDVDAGASAVERIDVVRDARGRVRHLRREGVSGAQVDHESADWIAAVREANASPARPDLSAWLPSTSETTPRPTGTQVALDALASSLDPGAAAARIATYQYDAAGNRIGVARVEGGVATSTAYVVSPADALVSVAGAPIERDAAGNVIFDGVFRYEYDQRNRLVRVRDATGVERLVVSWDPLGRPARVVDGGVVRVFAWDGHDLIHEEDGAGAPRRLTAYAGEIDQPIAQFEAGQTRWLVADHAWSIVAVTDATGAVLERYRHDEFGRLLGVLGAGFQPAASTVDHRPGFQGRPSFSSVPLIDFRLRAYSPDWGRFLQMDPIGIAGGLNLYSFARNNPLLYVDPTGEFPWLILLAGALIGGGISAAANWDKEGWDFWIAVFGGAIAGAGLAFGLPGLIAGGALGGGLVGGYEGGKLGGVRGALIGFGVGAGVGAAGGAFGGFLSSRIATPIAGRITSSLVNRGVSSTTSHLVGTYTGVAAEGLVLGPVQGGVGAFGNTTGLSLAAGNDLETSLRLGAEAIPEGIESGALYGPLGAIAGKGAVQLGGYVRTNSIQGTLGAEGEAYVSASIRQPINTTHRTPEGKIPDLWGRIRGDVKNTARVPSLSAQNGQLRSILNDIRSRGGTMTLFVRPGVTAGPRSSVGREVAAGRIVLRDIPQLAILPGTAPFGWNCP